MAVSRRRFIGGSVLVVPAVFGRIALGQGLEQFTISEPPCTDDPRLTPAVPLDATFRAGAPLRSAVAEAGIPGTRLTLSGTVAGVKCGRISGARVDIWQADSRGAYDASGFRLRGHQVTDARGGFSFQTILPGATPGRAKHIGLRVQVKGKLDFATEIFFPDDPVAATDKRFKKELVLKLVKTQAGQSAIFDVTLGL